MHASSPPQVICVAVVESLGTVGGGATCIAVERSKRPGARFARPAQHIKGGRHAPGSVLVGPRLLWCRFVGRLPTDGPFRLRGPRRCDRQLRDAKTVKHGEARRCTGRGETATRQQRASVLAHSPGFICASNSSAHRGPSRESFAVVRLLAPMTPDHLAAIHTGILLNANKTGDEQTEPRSSYRKTQGNCAVCSQSLRQNSSRRPGKSPNLLSHTLLRYIRIYIVLDPSVSSFSSTAP